MLYIPPGQSDWRDEFKTDRPGRQWRKSDPEWPQHASAIIFGLGMSGLPWSEVVDHLKFWRFRTSNRRHWNEANVRQFWQSHAIPAMKMERGRALEGRRGMRSSYLNKLRRTAPSGRLPFNDLPHEG